VIPLGDAPALARLRIDRHASSDGLTRAAIHAVVVLARRRGVRIVPRSAASGSSGGSLPAPLVFGLPVALLALVGLVLTRRRSAREHRQDHREPDAQA
jgi:FAD/FMN-containing dehydrogenase